MKANTDINKERAYKVKNYNPLWVAKFELIKKSFEQIWKNALAIEHVGSTSISDMKAKPIIDTVIILKGWSDLTEEVEKMKALGYIGEENFWSDHSWLFYKIHNTEEGPEKTENVHVLVTGSPKIDQFINIRNYLRAHPERAKAYSELKEELFKKFPNNYFAYRDGKQEFLKETERLTNRV